MLDKVIDFVVPCGHKADMLAGGGIDTLYTLICHLNNHSPCATTYIYIYYDACFAVPVLMS